MVSASRGFRVKAKASVWEVTYVEIVFGEISKILLWFSIGFAVTHVNRFSVILRLQLRSNSSSSAPASA